MRADPAAQLRLLDLQELDTRLAQLRHRRRSVPQIAELATLEQRAAALRDQEVAVRTAVSDLERAQAKADADVEAVRDRIARDQRMLEAGSVASARQLEDLQHEIASLTTRIAVLEDAELEVMEQLEDAQRRASAVAADVTALAEQRAAAEAARDAAFRDIDAEGTRVAAERARVAPELPADLLGLYDKVRTDAGGVGAAALHRGRCQGCQLTLTPADLGRIRGLAADEVVRCEECRRILVRTPESGL
ncbi:MAG: C4-type zinc ribbon domain-containing protein [Candidatus Nanopelagicales bacterium]|jgi:predicted  nucleic acid-binding Zn-ribbon protein|nr:C4-type zinc ribbon domain-containing protein [Candidatus Nanopelagicales bacterium]